MLRILLVDDSKDDRFLFRSYLPTRFSREAEFLEADTLRAALNYLSYRSIDVIALDLGLPDSEGKATFEAIRNAAPDIPIVILTGMADRYEAEKLIIDGAAEYIVKGTTKPQQIYEILANSVLRARYSIRMTAEEAELVKRHKRSSREFALAIESGDEKVRRTKEAEVARAKSELDVIQLGKLDQIITYQKRFDDKLDLHGEKIGALETRISVHSIRIGESEEAKNTVKKIEGLLNTKIPMIDDLIGDLKTKYNEMDKDLDTQRIEAARVAAVREYAEKMEANDRKSTELVVDFQKHKMTLRTKIILGVIAALATSAPFWMPILIDWFKK